MLLVGLLEELMNRSHDRVNCLLLVPNMLDAINMSVYVLLKGILAI